MASKKPGWKEILRPYYLKALVAAIILLGTILVFGNSLKLIIIIGILTAAASLSTFYQNFFKSPVNFELIKFSTILVAVSYGAMLGIAVALVSTIISKIMSEKLDQTAISSIVAIVIIALAAAAFRSTDIALLGIALVIAYHAMTVPVQLALGGSPLYGLIYVGTNLMFNLFLFIRIAPMAVKLM